MCIVFVGIYVGLFFLSVCLFCMFVCSTCICTHACSCMGLQDEVLDTKIIKKALDKRECEEFEMALHHKSKLQLYTNFKQNIGFAKYLEYVKQAHLLDLKKIPLGTHGLIEELGRYANGGGSQEHPNCVACTESVDHDLYQCASYDSQRLIFWTI